MERLVGSRAARPGRPSPLGGGCGSAHRPMRWGGQARLGDALQDDDGDLAGRLLPVVMEAWIDVGVLRVEALVLVAVRNMRAGVELVLAHLDGDLGMLEEVVVPGRVRRRAALRGDDHDVVSVAGVHERVLAHVARLGSLGGEDQHLATLEWARGCLSVRPKVLDQVAVEVLKACSHQGFDTHLTRPIIPRTVSIWLWPPRHTPAQTSTPSSSKPPRMSSSASSNR